MKHIAVLLMNLLVFAVWGCSTEQPSADRSRETVQDAPVRPSGNSAAEKSDRVAGEYIVALTNGGNAETILEVFAGFSPSVKREMGRGRFLVELAGDPGPEAVAERAAGHAAVRYAEPNRVVGIPTPVEQQPRLERRKAAD